MRAVWLGAPKASHPQLDDHLATDQGQVAEVTRVAAADHVPHVGQLALAAAQRTATWTIPSQSYTCSTTTPAPGGKSTCGPTVHPLGGPADRRAGAFYGLSPVACNQRWPILTYTPTLIAREVLTELSHRGA